MMKFSHSLLILALVAATLSRPAHEQKSFDQAPAAMRQLIAVKVTGNQHFPENAIVAASGLQLGTTVTEDDFKKAATRLGAYGIFKDVGYTYSFASAGTKLELKVTEVDKFVPARFEDFVWFSDEDLLKRIQERAPLFQGELPLSGRLPDLVSDILQALLVENDIPGNVEYERAGVKDGPVDALIYRVADVLIQIHDIDFVGANPEDVPALKSAAARLRDTEYARTALSGLVQHQLLPVYHARGYLKATFGTPQTRVVTKPSQENDSGLKKLTVVDVIFPVVPGQQYKLKGIEWSGNHEFSSEALQKMVRAPVSEPANTVRLSDNLKDIQKLYGSRGYVTAAIKADADFDDAASTVTVRLNVTEGPVYHMGELAIRGLDNTLEAKLRNLWKIRPGEVYNSTYVSEYLPEAHKLLPASLDWDVASHITANVRDKTVDIDLIYSAKAPK